MSSLWSSTLTRIDRLLFLFTVYLDLICVNSTYTINLFFFLCFFLCMKTSRISTFIHNNQYSRIFCHWNGLNDNKNIIRTKNECMHCQWCPESVFIFWDSSFWVACGLCLRFFFFEIEQFAAWNNKEWKKERNTKNSNNNNWFTSQKCPNSTTLTKKEQIKRTKTEIYDYNFTRANVFFVRKWAANRSVCML